MKIKSLKKKYEEYYSKNIISKLYPSEYLVRIFLSQRNKNKFNFPEFKDKLLLDLSCGDGRNLELFYNLKFKLFATEISSKIINQIRKSIKFGVSLRVGTNSNLPFKDNFFDYIVSSHSCYYIDNNENLKKNLLEIRRTMKTGSFFIGTIPSTSNYYFKNSIQLKKNHYLIKYDYLNLRNNYVLAGFQNKKDLLNELSKLFKIVDIGILNNNYFGIKEKMFIFILKK